MTTPYKNQLIVFLRNNNDKLSKIFNKIFKITPFLNLTCQIKKSCKTIANRWCRLCIKNNQNSATCLGDIEQLDQVNTRHGIALAIRTARTVTLCRMTTFWRGNEDAKQNEAIYKLAKECSGTHPSITRDRACGINLF